jgi:hypothetical protein
MNNYDTGVKSSWTMEKSTRQVEGLFESLLAEAFS